MILPSDLPAWMVQVCQRLSHEEEINLGDEISGSTSRYYYYRIIAPTPQILAHLQYHRHLQFTGVTPVGHTHTVPDSQIVTLPLQSTMYDSRFH